MMHWFTEVQAKSPKSGLSGAADLEEPVEEPEPKDLRSRFRRLRQSVAGTLAGLPRVLRLVWQASPALTIGLGLATVLSGVVPVLTALTAKYLINAVLHAILVHAQKLPDTGTLALPFFTWTSSAIGVIVALAVIQFAIYAFTSLLGTVRNITQQLLQERVTMQISLLVMQKAAELDLPFFEESVSYDLLRRAQTEAANRPVGMISTAFGLGQTTITFATMIAVLLALSPFLALVALVSPIPSFIADTRYGWRGYNIARWSSPMRRRMTYLTTLVTTDSFAKEVKIFGLGGYFIERFRLLSQVWYDRQRRNVVARYLVGFAWGTITTLVGSLTYLYVALQAVMGKLSIGDLTLYTAAASSVQGSIQGLLSGFSGMYEHNLYLSNLYELLQMKPSLPVPADLIPLPNPLRGEVRFEHVSFSYPGSGAVALQDVSFTIAPGETIAVVGRNGAGKTTLIKLLCRLYDPQAGRILLDGNDIRDYDPDELRSVIAAMFQDYVAYQATAAENIGLGELADLENQAKVQQAARKGGAAPLIEEMALGYDTPLGKWFDRGVNLSGGEWQKIALSRAFMRDARILVLDEPTSALDAQAEFDLFERLRALSKGRTAVYISHRFSTVRQADRILFIEEGKLIEEGTHQELMRLGGRYARLFSMQAAAYTGEPLPELEPI
jgi:ATP-binding cassette subfamily B protein